MFRRVASFALMAAVLLGGMVACAPKPAPSGATGLSNQHSFMAPTNEVKLSGPYGDAALMPGVNAPALVSKTVRVGLLLPLTGRNAELGRAMQDAATVALYDKYASLSLRENTVRVELLPKDTGDTPEQAIAAVNQAISDGATLMIGPIFSDATEAVAPIARAKNIPVISLSNNLASAGQGVFAFGNSPQDQTARIVRYALKNEKSRIAVLAPNSALGSMVLNTTKEILAAQGLSLAAQGAYVGQGLGIDAAVTQLMPNSTPAFDALLIPESGNALPTILRTLAAHGITSQNVQFMSTGVWDDTALLRRVPLDGAWIATLNPENTTLFETRFRTAYHYAPPRITGLAYDAVSLAVTLATSGHEFDIPSLTNDVGFLGPANGAFRLRSNGKTERGLAVLQIGGSAFRVLDPAPEGFSGKDSR